MTTTIKPTTKWTKQDRQAFADRNFLKSQTVPNKKRLASRKACRPGNWD